MDLYVKISWPQSQKWEGKEGVIAACDGDDPVLFVPKDLYDEQS